MKRLTIYIYCVSEDESITEREIPIAVQLSTVNIREAHSGVPRFRARTRARAHPPRAPMEARPSRSFALRTFTEGMNKRGRQAQPATQQGAGEHLVLVTPARATCLTVARRCSTIAN